MDMISSKLWSLSQLKQASPVKLEADVILIKIFEQLITYRNPCSVVGASFGTVLRFDTVRPWKRLAINVTKIVLCNR